MIFFSALPRACHPDASARRPPPNERALIADRVAAAARVRRNRRRVLWRRRIGLRHLRRRLWRHLLRGFRLAYISTRCHKVLPFSKRNPLLSGARQNVNNAEEQRCPPCQTPP